MSTLRESRTLHRSNRWHARRIVLMRGNSPGYQSRFIVNRKSETVSSRSDDSSRSDEEACFFGIAGEIMMGEMNSVIGEQPTAHTIEVGPAHQRAMHKGTALLEAGQFDRAETMLRRYGRLCGRAALRAYVPTAAA
jgi:hypothetical protein